MAKRATAKKTATARNGVSKKPTTVKMDYQGKEIEVDLTCSFDTTGFEESTIIDWYKLMHLGRRLDEKAALYLKQAKGWSYHAPYAGHDGIQLALGKIFRANKDYLYPYYRDMLTNLSAGLSVEEIILNGLSKDTDVAGGGRHMSNHFAKPSINIQNVSSNVSNHSLHVAGTARAIKFFGGDEVSIYSGGESGCSEGYFSEAINVTTLEKLPALFVIQNNKFGISVPLPEQTSNQVVSDNFTGYKELEIIQCDGRDPFDSYNALKKAYEYIQAGKGPAMVHADCDRMLSHSNSDRHELYISDEEREAKKRRDPLMQFRYFLLDKKILTKKEIEDIEEANKEAVFAAADKAEAAPNADGSSWNQFILPEPYVKISDNTETALDNNAEKVAYIEAINKCLKEEFRRNEKTIMWGQDIGKGGVFNVVKGMPEEFGKTRVFNAPIAEDCIVGTANGFSRYDKEARVVIEGAEFADYFWPAMEQYIELSHDYWRTKGQFAPNVVIRLASGGYIQGGLYHSQNIEGSLAAIPGVRIVTPAFADDAVGLLRNAIRSEGPTMYLEPKFLYNFKPAFGPYPQDDFIIPFGKAKVRREGTDVTIVTYGTGVHLSNYAADDLAKEGISCEIVDLRSILPWDKETVFESVKKTNRVVVAHEDKVFGGFGGEISATITQEMFEYLDAPIMRTGSKDVPVGFAKEYETAILPNKDTIAEVIRKVVNY